MKSSGRNIVALLVCSIIVALIALIALVFFVGAHIPPETRTSERDFTELSIAILLLGELVMLAVFAVFVWIGIDDWHDHAPLSLLYRPQVAVKGFFFAYMTMLFAELIDLQAHNLKPHWMFLYTPLARLFQSILLLGVFLSFLWVAVVILKGRRAARAAEVGGMVREVTEITVTTTKREGERPC